MINTNDITAANRISAMLDDVGGFVLNAKSGTDLAALEAVTPAEATYSAISPTSEVVSSGALLNEMTTRKNLMGEYEHDGVLEVIVDKMWAVINQCMVVTRDRAIPMAMRIVDALNSIYNLSFTEAAAFTVVQLAPPESLTSDLGVSLIDKYSTNTYPRVNISGGDQITINQGEGSDTELDPNLVELFNTNYKARLPGLLNSDNLTLSDHIRHVFVFNSSDFGAQANYENAHLYLSQLAVIDLLLSCDTLPNFISGYDTVIVNYLNGEAAYYAKQLAMVDGFSARQLTSKALIADVDWSSYRLMVNTNVYNIWLEAGGEVEALIGYVYSGGDITAAYDAILDNLTKYKEQYNIAKLRQCEILERDQLLMFKKNLPFQFNFALLADGFDSDLAAKIVDGMKGDISNIPNSIGDRFYMAVLHLIDKHVFPSNSVFEIASEMNRISPKIVGINPEEASRLVVTNMAIIRVVDQLSITRV